MGGFILTVVIAIVFGGIINSLMAGKIKGGVAEAAIAGLVGAWIGAYMPYFSSFGPKVLDIAIIPSAIGATIAVLILSFLSLVAQKSS